MGRVNIQHGFAVERWSPALFLFAGVLLVGYAALNGLAAVTETAYTTVEDVVGPAGFVLGFVGALGLYPALADRSPTVARTGAVCLGLGAAGFSVITMNGITVLAGGQAVASTGAPLLLVALGMIPGYVAFGVASRRSGQVSRTVGLLLFGPAVIFTVMLFQPPVYGALGLFSEATMAWSNFVISAGQAAAHLVIGYTLRASATPGGRAAASTDVTVG